MWGGGQGGVVNWGVGAGAGRTSYVSVARNRVTRPRRSWWTGPLSAAPRSPQVSRLRCDGEIVGTTLRITTIHSDVGNTINSKTKTKLNNCPLSRPFLPPTPTPLTRHRHKLIRIVIVLDILIAARDPHHLSVEECVTRLSILRLCRCPPLSCRLRKVQP